MEIRPARSSDIPAIARLWVVAFPGNRTEADRARMLETGGRYGGLDTVLVAEEAGGIVGAAKIYALTQHLTGRAMPMMGLAAVAVDPAARRRGIAARLCREAVAAAVARGDIISVLYPFRPDYYERLGWGLVGRLVEHRFATAALPGCPEAEAVRLARLPADAEGIAGCYRRVSERGHGPMSRDRRVWAYRLSGEELGVRPLDEATALGGSSDPRRQVIVYDEGGTRGIEGYALLRYLPARQPADRAVVARELVAESDAAYRGLLGYLAGKAGDWPRARHFARPEERFGDRLRDPRPPGASGARSLYFPVGRIIQGPMLRILDLPAAMARRRWFDGSGTWRAGAPRAAGSLAFGLEVSDDLRPENGGAWTVHVSHGAADGGAGAGDAGEGGNGGSGGGEASVERGRPAEGAPVLTAGIATVSRLWAGELSPSDAVRVGHAQLAARDPLQVARLDAAFAVRETFWLLDEF